MENELFKLRQTRKLRLLNSHVSDVNLYEQKPKFVSTKHLEELEEILDQFCLSALTDKNDTVKSLDSILNFYKLKDWSSKLKRSDQKLKNIGENQQRDSFHNRILVITGQPGIGKTRFLTNWLNKRKTTGFTFKPKDSNLARLITVTTLDETDNDSLKIESERSIIFIEEYIEVNKCNSDIWQLLDELNLKARKARCKGQEVNPNLGATLSALTSEQEDFERARQLRQLGSRFFASLSPATLHNRQSNLPIVIIMDGIEYLEDPLAKTPEAVRCIDWLFSCHGMGNEAALNENGTIKSGGLPIVPSRTRFILTCSSSHYISHHLAKCPLITVIEYATEIKQKEFHQAKSVPTSIGNLEEAYTISKENNTDFHQQEELISLFPIFSKLDMFNHYSSETKLDDQSDQDSQLMHYLQMVRTRITNHIFVKLYENWSLRHNALARNMFIHELNTTSFGFNSSTKYPKNISSWEDYIERLLTTQSIRQLLLHLLQKWSVEFECDIITAEEAMLASSSAKRRGLSSQSSNDSNDEYQELSGTDKINFSSLRRKAMVQLSKDWTIGWVGMVFHVILVAFRFTWCKNDTYNKQDERCGFKFEDVLYILHHINLSESWVPQCILPSTIMALQSPLLGFYCLRLFHRVGAFSPRIGGAILNITNLHGYLTFSHEMVYSVVRQMLARDNSATGVQLPLATTAFRWCKETEQGDTLLRILTKLRSESLSKIPNQSVSSHSLSLIEDNLYKSKPKITFKKIGHKIQAILSLTESSTTALYNDQSAGDKKDTDSTDTEDFLLIPTIRKRIPSLLPTVQLIPDIYRTVLRSSDLLSPSVDSSIQLSMDDRANTRHIILLTEIMNYLVKRSNHCLTHTFISRLILTQVELICKVDNLNSVKAILNNLEFILMHPCLLLCFAFPTYYNEIFTGFIPNAHLFIGFWQFIQHSFMLIDKYQEKKGGSSSESHMTSVTSAETQDLNSSFGRVNTPTNISNSNSNQENTNKLVDFAQSALYYLECKSICQQTNSETSNVHNNLAELNELSGENKLESLIWIIAEFIYFLGNEVESVKTLSKLAENFIHRETLSKADVVQLSYLGLSVSKKLRYLRNGVDESVDDKMMLCRSLAYEIELKVTDWEKELQMLTVCSEEECTVMKPNISIALAYMKIYRLESIIGTIKTCDEQLNLLEYQINQTIEDVKQFNYQFIDKVLSAISKYLLAKLRFLQMKITDHESLLYQAISECMVDQGEYHPLLAEWLTILAMSLQKPSDENESPEANFLRMTLGNVRAQACLRWALDIMTYNEEILIRPVVHPPTSVLSSLKKSIYLKLHKSLLQRLPTYLIMPQNQPTISLSSSLSLTFTPMTSRSIINSAKHLCSRKGSNPLTDFSSIISKYSNANSFDHLNVYQSLPAEICLQLTISLLKNRRQISLQEASLYAAFVLHERILFLGVEHPATTQISRILDLIQHDLTLSSITKQTEENDTSTIEPRFQTSKLSDRHASHDLFLSHRSHDRSPRQLSSSRTPNKVAKSSSQASLLYEQSTNVTSSISGTNRTSIASTRLNYQQARMREIKYESPLKHLGKIHRFLAKKIDQTNNMKKYADFSIYDKPQKQVVLIQTNRI
ncbi:unnamed protein product [Heterobilharzia americana]|nr:unnamed protein product [Heterobilharzia americana]